MALIRHWKLDDNAASTTVVATVGSNATSQRNTSLMAIGAGNGPGGALDDAGLVFDRDLSDYLAANNPTLSSNGTIACWFKTDETSFSKIIFDVRDAANDGPLLFWNVAGPYIQGVRNPDSVFSSSGYTDNAWHHVLFSWTNTFCYLYIDGSLVNTNGPHGTQTVSVTATIEIGRSKTSGQGWWDGALADVRLYDTNEAANVATIRNEAKPTASATISGTAEVGQTLTAVPTSNDSTVTWAYQWYRDADGSGTADTTISGATSSTYVLTGDDLNKYVRVGVTATNTGGAGLVSDQGLSDYTAQVAAASTPPTITSATITGTSQVGQTLTAVVVTDQDPVDSIAYQWEKASDGSGTGAADISGATSSTLALTYADLGALLDAGDAYVRYGAIATKNSFSSDEDFSAWQQVTIPSGGGLVSSPLKSPFLIA